MRLAELGLGTQLRITGFAEQTDYASQLQRMGLVPGTVITVVRRAPLGDPLEVRLRGYSLALRPSEADVLLFEVIEP